MYINDPVIELVQPPGTGHDLTEICSSVVLNISKPQASGQNTYGRGHQRREKKGLWDGSVTVNLHHNYAATTGISNVLWTMLQSDTPWMMHVRVADAPISTSNPEWQIPVSLSELPTIEGEPGELAASSITFELAGLPVLTTDDESIV